MSGALHLKGKKLMYICSDSLSGTVLQRSFGGITIKCTCTDALGMNGKPVWSIMILNRAGAGS